MLKPFSYCLAVFMSVYMVMALLLHDNYKFNMHALFTPVVQVSEDCSRGEDTDNCTGRIG